MRYLFTFLICSSIFSLGFGQGALFDEEGYLEFEELQATRGWMPDIISYRDYAPYPNMQINASCVAQAFGNAMVMGYAIHNGLTDQKDLITVLKPSPLQIYFKNKDPYDFYCDRGLMMPAVARYLLTLGASSWAQVELPAGYWPFYPYTQWCNNYPPEESEHFQNVIIPKRIYRLSSIDAIRTALKEKMIVTVGMSLTESFLNCDTRVWEPSSSESPYGMGHAVTIIGYQDDFKGDIGAFLILNSYGENWGEDGMTWILYKDALKYFGEQYAVDMSGKSRVFGRPAADLPVTETPLNFEDSNATNLSDKKSAEDYEIDARFNQIDVGKLYEDYIKGLTDQE